VTASNRAEDRADREVTSSNGAHDGSNLELASSDSSHDRSSIEVAWCNGALDRSDTEPVCSNAADDDANSKDARSNTVVTILKPRRAADRKRQSLRPTLRRNSAARFLSIATSACNLARGERYAYNGCQQTDPAFSRIPPIERLFHRNDPDEPLTR
jgi:hypothetical protein